MRAGHSKMSSGSLGRVPDPLGFEAVDRQRALRERREVHPDERQHARARAVAEHAAGELGAGKKCLDDAPAAA